MSTNPFEEEVDEIQLNQPGTIVDRENVENAQPLSTSAINSEIGNIQGDADADGRQSSFPSSLTYDYMAKKLLDDNFILTALEFHAELLESGRELRRLRDYFSNPVHFESVASSNRLEFLPSNLPRTSSAQTLDSLDFTRYSDDGDRQADDRVAVLEFELRKAKDTIRSLREQLTVASETRPLTRDGESTDTLTHVTGTGPGANFMAYSSEARSSLSNIPLKPHEERALNFLVHEFLLQNGHKLTAVAFSDEVDYQDFEDWDDVGLNVPRPPDLRIMYRDFCTRVPNYIQRKDASCSANLSAEENGNFELGECDPTELLNKLNSENSSLLDRNQHLEIELDRVSRQVVELQKALDTAANASMVDKTSAIVEKMDEQRLSMAAVSERDQRKDHMAASRNVPVWLKDEVISMVSRLSSGEQNRFKLPQIAPSGEELVRGLAVALPRIIPNVLLNKREELITPLLSVAALHPDAKIRDQLLNSFFGLMKRPDDEQRQQLVSGCVAYVKAVGAVRAETELLPQCWEQMNHKHVERRLLVAETCGAIIPYLPASITSSLILSMLQQMLTEDKSELVREAVVRSLAVLCIFVEDRDKFGQLVDLMQRSLTDQNEQVVLSARSMLVPCLGFWCIELGQFQSTFVNLFVKKISQLITTSGMNQAANEQLLCNYFIGLRNLTTLLFWTVLRSGPYCGTVKKVNSTPVELELNRFPKVEGLLDDPSALLGDERELTRLVALYDEWTSREWYQTWDQLDYVIKEMFPQLATALSLLDCTLSKVVRVSVNYFRHAVKLFGRGFSVTKMRPIFLTLLKFEIEGKVDLGSQAISRAALPVYLAGVLGAHHTDVDKKELKSYLKSVVVTMAQSGSSCNSILVSFTELSVSYPDMELVLSVVWDLITHKVSNVRRLCALILCRLVRSTNDVSCLRNKLVPALITLASDREMQVRATTVAGFGAVLEVSAAYEDIMEKVRMQLGAMLDEAQNADVIVHIVRMFAQVAPNLETKFRDEFVLPQMAIVCARNVTLVQSEAKTAIASALFDAYSALSCCYLSHSAVIESFLPGLKGLLKDLDVERAKVARSIIRDLENKVALTNTVDRKSSVLGPTEMAVDEMKLKMMTKFRDLKDKMDQHKENVPSLFKKK